MNPADPNVQSIELVAAALGDLREELVLVGGCAASLLIDAAIAPLPRITYDVDLLAEVTALTAYHQLEKRFEQRGFKRDTMPDAPICRWRIGELKVDLMPTDEHVLGFSNRWYAEAAATATRLLLPSGNAIYLISSPAFLATKFEAFLSRGKSDWLASHDAEDIINVLEGRVNVVAEIAQASPSLKNYLIVRFSDMVHSPGFAQALPGLITFDELYAQRVDAVKQRIAQIAAIAQQE